jgi:gentisate 1,2-dioxygenase
MLHVHDLVGAQARAALDAAGRFVNTELAERRNLILNNPVPGNFYPTVTTLVSAYQMVKAGEVARSHRHTANALRFVVQAEPGMFTVVDGTKIPMEPSDVLLTPNWAWHGHANESKASGYWIDFLDVPLTHLLGPMFFEHHEEMVEHTDIVAPDSPARFAFSETVRRLAEAGLAVLFSTHDPNLALRHADEVWLLAAGRVHGFAAEGRPTVSREDAIAFLLLNCAI